MQFKGKELSLNALNGKACGNIPVGLFTWGFDYYWKVRSVQME